MPLDDDRRYKALPLREQPPFYKQTNRSQAVHGDLLKDVPMTRVLKPSAASQQLDKLYEPNYAASSTSKRLAYSSAFADVLGRVPIHKQGTRTAADGNAPSTWRPTSPSNLDLTRKATPSPGVAFGRQITRAQDVNGKLLEDIAMTRVLFASGFSSVPEYYEKAHDSMHRPLPTSNRTRVGRGAHSFPRQVGRVALHRTGNRSAAEGSFPSTWEPGAGFHLQMNNAGKSYSFAHGPGRIDLHLSGMRGAPPKPEVGGSSGGGYSSSMGGTFDKSRSFSFDKQMSREVWTSLPMSIK